jgi:hypothetical protein
MQYNPMARGRSAALLATLAAGLAIGGCEKQVREAKAPESTDAVQTASLDRAAAADASAEPTTAAATDRLSASAKPADTQPALSLLLIDGRAVQFPPTKLQLGTGGGDTLAAEMFSDLPKSALRKYDGNEMYLEMTLADGDGPQKVDGATWQFKSAHSGKADSANGIFLNGQTTHLQPVNVIVRFERRDAGLYAQLMGQFRAFEDGMPEALAPFVAVQGELPVEIVSKR